MLLSLEGDNLFYILDDGDTEHFIFLPFRDVASNEGLYAQVGILDPLTFDSWAICGPRLLVAMAFHSDTQNTLIWI